MRESILLYNLLKDLRFICCTESDIPLRERILKLTNDYDNKWLEMEKE